MNFTSKTEEKPSIELSLRDWFAGQALVGLLSQRIRNESEDDPDYEPVYRGGFIARSSGPDEEEAAVDAYGFADAMLAAREKGKE